MLYTKQQYDDVFSGKIQPMTRNEELALGREVARGRIDLDNPPKWAKKAIQDEKLWLAVFGDANSFANCIDYTDHYNVRSEAERAAEREEVKAFLANGSINEIKELKNQVEARVAELLSERDLRKNPNNGSSGATAREGIFTPKEVCEIKAATNQQLDEEIHDHEWILEQIRNTLTKRGESPLSQLPKEPQAQPQEAQQQPNAQPETPQENNTEEAPKEETKLSKKQRKKLREQQKAQQQSGQPEASQEPGSNEQVVDETIPQQEAAEAAHDCSNVVPPQEDGSESLNDILAGFMETSNEIKTFKTMLSALMPEEQANECIKQLVMDGMKAAIAEEQANEETLKSQNDTLGELESLVNSMKNHNNQMEQQFAQILQQINGDPQVVDVEVVTEPERKAIPQQSVAEAAINYGNGIVPPAPQQPGFNIGNFVKDQAAGTPNPGVMDIGRVNPVPNFTNQGQANQLVNGPVACGLPVAGQEAPQQPQVTNPQVQQTQQQPRVWPPIGKAYFSMSPEEKSNYILKFIKDGHGSIKQPVDFMSDLTYEAKVALLKSRISFSPDQAGLKQFQILGLVGLLSNRGFQNQLTEKGIPNPDKAKLVQVPVRNYAAAEADKFDMAFLVRKPNSKSNKAVLVLFNSFPVYKFDENCWRWLRKVFPVNIRKDETAFQEQRDVETVQEQRPSQKPANEALATIGSVLNGIMGNTEYAQKIKQALAGAVQQ